MKALFDISHPAHAHFFKNPAKILRERGHDVVFASRDKDVTLSLLDELGVHHHPLSTQGRGVGGLLRELGQRDFALWRLTWALKPDVMAAIGGTYVAHVGRLTGIPGLGFYDTEIAKLQNLITYPLAHHVYVPECYHAWLPKRHTRYAGYHELAYLHPDYFVPDRAVAVSNGLAEVGDTFLLRLVSWEANHDIGEVGWSEDLAVKLVGKLAALGKVVISSEKPLPPSLAPYAYEGARSALHHLLAFCRLVVGESATMASEATVLGVPSIYAATSGRGYTDEQETRYGLVTNVRAPAWAPIEAAVDTILARPQECWRERREALLADTTDVAVLVADECERWSRQRSLA